MKAIMIPAVSALLAGVTLAGNGTNEPVSGEEKNEVAPAGGESEGLLPSAYKTLLKNDHVDIQWGGRLFIDAGFFDADPSFAGDSTTVVEDSVEFRTVRFHAQGNVHDTVDFKVDMEFEGNDENNFKDVYLGLNTSLGYVKVGHIKEPLSLEQLTSSRFITFMERSLGDVFAPSRNIGAQISNYMEDSGINWAAGIFQDSADGALGQGNAQYAYTGRVTYTPIHQEGGQSVLHLGAGYSLRSDLMGMNTFTGSPEAHPVASFVGDSYASDDAHVLNLEGAYVQGPLSFQAEYFMANVNGATGSPDADNMGFYILGSYFLTGENRAYKPKGGVFSRVKPNEDFGRGGMGAVEAAFRFSSSDFDDGTDADAFDEEAQNFTVGLNWYLNSHSRVMLNYVHSEFESGPTDDSMDAILLRWQVDF